ncbi:MAG: hypothetical protein JRI85_07725 [Deltaproteobacteria bacterium]|nr:hypothetical protein [Deltaproteobacteria bacterium]
MAKRIQEAEINIAALTPEARFERMLSLAHRFLAAKAKAGQIPLEETSKDKALTLMLSWKERWLSPLATEFLAWVITQKVQTA